MGIKNKIIFCLILALLLFLPTSAFAQEEGQPLGGAVENLIPLIDSLPDSQNINVWVYCRAEWECSEEERSRREFFFNSSPTYVDLEVQAYNPSSEITEYYLFAKREGSWEALMYLDSAEPGEEKYIPMPLQFEYAGLSSETDELAIVAVSSAGAEKYSFSIFENWQPYEELNGMLVIFGIPLSIIIGGLLMVFIAIVTAFVFFKRKPAVLVEKAKQYTLKSLFLPSLKEKSWRERISLIILHPIFWIIELLAGSVIILIIFLEAILGMDLGVGFTVFFIGGICAMASPIAYLFIGWLIDWYEREPLRFIAAIFFWGVFAAFISFFVNTIIGFFTDMLFGFTMGEIGLFFSMVVGTVIVAPVVEETSKGFGVLMLSANKEMDDVLDGLLYGFGVGMGFAAIENWLYFTSYGPAITGGILGWAILIFNRSLFSALGHGWMTGTTGAIIAFLKTRFKKHSYLYFIPAVIVAIIIHATFNFVAFIDGLVSYFFGNPIPIFDPILVFILTAIFAVVIIFQLMKNREELLKAAGKRK